MNFSYEGYTNLIKTLRDNKYHIADYQSWKKYEKCVILRHDIDYDLKKALQMSRIEHDVNVKSTYFLLLTSDFYNVFSQSASCYLREIINYGHEIGLHFDEMRYNGLDIDEIREKIIDECKSLGCAVEAPITTVSIHRPSKMMLEADLEIPGIINSYGSDFFKGFKYVSDSRRMWRESVESIIESQQFARLHILTHAFWYNEKEQDLKTSLSEFVNRGCQDRYSIMYENFTRLADELPRDEVYGGNI